MPSTERPAQPDGITTFRADARHVRAYAHLGSVAIPILWERRMLSDVAHELGGMMLVALAAKPYAEVIARVGTEEQRAKMADALDDIDAAKRYQSELRAAIRAQQHADRGTFAV